MSVSVAFEQDADCRLGRAERGGARGSTSEPEENRRHAVSNRLRAGLARSRPAVTVARLLLRRNLVLYRGLKKRGLLASRTTP